MNNQLLRACSWIGLGFVFALLFTGIKLDWLIYAVVTAVLIVFTFLLEFEVRGADSRKVALVGVLVALTVASRQLLHGVEFSPIFFLVVLSGYVFGFTSGFAVGSLSMFTSNFFLGHGPWTPFQMFALGLTGALASFLPKTRRYEIHILTIYCVFTAYFYGFIMDIFSWIAFIPTHTFSSFIGILSSGMIANTARALGNIFFMSLIGPMLLKSLKRFRRRLTYKRY